MTKGPTRQKSKKKNRLPAMKKDEVFKSKMEVIKSFEFNDAVASVFDDMVERSIPFYSEIHRIIIDLVNRYLPNNSTIYDLGCSTGTTIALIEKALIKAEADGEFIGIDNSNSMIKRSEEKLNNHKVRNFTMICDDIENVELKPSDMIIMNYTLQFIAVEKRKNLLKKIFTALKPGGLFIFSEKIISSNTTVNLLLTDLYYDFKRRNGYSELEISQKREALENVLIPFSTEDQLSHLREAGFNNADVLFRWYNFASFLGVKT
jgi:tRNA (cmo5U34)-methyltransferase